jgi:hypothetical protein
MLTVGLPRSGRGELTTAAVSLCRRRWILLGLTGDSRPGAGLQSSCERQAVLAGLASRALDRVDVRSLMPGAADALAARLGSGHAAVLELDVLTSQLPAPRSTAPQLPASGYVAALAGSRW